MREITLIDCAVKVGYFMRRGIKGGNKVEGAHTKGSLDFPSIIPYNYFQIDMAIHSEVTEDQQISMTQERPAQCK